MIFAANWKMNQNLESTEKYFSAFFANLKISSDVKIIFFPPAFLAERVSSILKKNKAIDCNVFWGAQNTAAWSSGAYTGENSPELLSQMGGSYALVGHSERRALFKEDSSQLVEKMRALRKHSLQALLCIGETLEEREQGRIEAVLEKQLEGVLSHLDLETNFIIAYEPIWSIGTGKVATVEQVKSVHGFIKQYLIDRGFGKIPLLYGGSVKPESVALLKVIPNVDGFLVGGASLDPDIFLSVCHTY